MNARAAIVLTVSSLALIPFGAFAQSTIPYEVGQYEFAQPLPELDDDVVTETVTEDATEAEQAVQSNAAPVFVSNPTIQTIDPSDSAYAGNETVPAARSIPVRAGADFVTTPTPAAGPAPVIYRDASRSAPAPGTSLTENVPGTPTYNAATYLPAGGQVVAFDRSAWLDECRARLDTYDNESERGKVMGALIGGVAGGVLGNRIAGAGHRTPGTIIGAGAGVAAGMAVGDAIDDHNRSRRDSYEQCEAYLDDYMRSVTAEAGSVQYVQPGQYMLVPVTVSVLQRVIYRERTSGN